MSHEDFFALLSVVSSLVRYGTYCQSIVRKETRPHVFSWFNWGLVVGIGTYAQFKLEGGPSVWGLALISFSCLAIACWSLFIGEKDITKSDWLTFGGALMAIAGWQLTKDARIALILVVAIDMLSYWPTVRKSWHDPWSEPYKSYFWAGLRYFFLLFAVPDPSLSTIAYPFWLMATDWGFMLYIMARQRALAAKTGFSA